MMSKLETKCSVCDTMADDVTVYVCGSCQQASCYQGEFICWPHEPKKPAKFMTVGELKKLNLEDKHYWHIDPDTCVTAHPLHFPSDRRAHNGD